MGIERAARQALDALENAYENGFLTGITGLKTIDIITALREALAEQSLQKLSDFHQMMEQEPAGIVWDASAPVVMDSSAPKNKNQEVAELRKQVAALKAVVDAWNNVEQEPVAWIEIERGIPMFVRFADKYKPNCDGFIPLYDAAIRTKDLTDDELNRLRHKIDWTAEWSYVSFARAVIAADREKNK